MFLSQHHSTQEKIFASDNIAHLLCVAVPSGLEKMLIEMGKRLPAGTFLSPPHPEPESLEKMKELASKYGQTIYPPDYLG